MAERGREFRVYGPKEIAEGMRRAQEAERPSLEDHEIGAPLVEPAVYLVQTVRFQSVAMFDRKKLLVTVQIIGDDKGKPGGRWDGTELTWSANVPKDRSRPPLSSKYWRALELVLGRRLRQSERPAHGLLIEHRFLARIKTVTRNYKGDPLPEQSRYSVCSDFLRVVG